MKEPKCTVCGGKHYKFQCWQNPKKQIKTKNAVKPLKIKPQSKITKKTNKLSSRKTNDRKELVKELDKITSLIVRKKYADKNGLVYCYTSGVRQHWKQMDCGHYIKRRYLNTRWDFDNLRPQSKYDNQTLDGNMEVYDKKIRQELGNEKVEALWQKARSNNKISTIELKEMLKNYKEIEKRY